VACQHAVSQQVHGYYAVPASDMSQTQQPEWNAKHRKYFLKQWDNQYQRSYWLHHVEGIMPACIYPPAVC